jgi:hypothetical protein
MLGAMSPAVSQRAERRRTLGQGELVIVAAAICLLVVATNLFDLYVNSLGKGLHVLDANWQFGWSHDLDTAILAAGLCAAIAGALRDASRPWIWRSTAAILGLFFLDEATPLHATIDSSRFGKLVYVPILLGLVACLWLLAADSDQRAPVLAGITVLVLSFAMHVVGVPTLRGLGYFNGIYQASVGLKEGLESAGLVLVVPSLWRLAAQRQT